MIGAFGIIYLTVFITSIIEIAQYGVDQNSIGTYIAV
jgi:hypothetical protein